MENKIISVCGPSGVGKTTLSKIVAVCLGFEDTIIVSGDDAHKWERGNENWKFITHLNPKANNLNTDFKHLVCLKKGDKISRPFYNHKTGKFTKPHLIQPKKNIIYEGLLSMHEDLAKLADISFYIDVEDSIKNQWKILRDSRKRGYEIHEITKTIQDRKADEEKFVRPQKNICDVVVRFKKEFDEKISLSFDYKKPSLTPLINDIKNLYIKLNSFVNISKKLSTKTFITQNKGGNLSFKFKDVIVITESGASFEQVNYFEGFGFYSLDGKSIFPDQRRPSMELGCHVKLGECCLHTHPLHALAILSCSESERILDKLFHDYALMDFVIPGKKLSTKLIKHRNLFLKNHGIFISRETIEECLESTLEIDKVCQDYLYSVANRKMFLYPDAVVLQNENLLYHSYVENLLHNASLVPETLTPQNVKELLNMEEEKYRKIIK